MWKSPGATLQKRLPRGALGPGLLVAIGQLHFNCEQHSSFSVPAREKLSESCFREEQSPSRVEGAKAALAGTQPRAGEEGQRGTRLPSILAVEP